MSAASSFFPAARGGKLAAHRTARQAVEQLIEELGDLDGLTAITADLARSTADLVDGARKAQDPRQFMQASTRLQQLTIRLAARLAIDDGAGVESGTAGDDRAAGLEGIVGSPASVGDGA